MLELKGLSFWFRVDFQSKTEFWVLKMFDSAELIDFSSSKSIDTSFTASISVFHLRKLTSFPHLILMFSRIFFDFFFSFSETPLRILVMRSMSSLAFAYESSFAHSWASIASFYIFFFSSHCFFKSSNLIVCCVLIILFHLLGLKPAKGLMSSSISDLTSESSNGIPSSFFSELTELCF